MAPKKKPPPGEFIDLIDKRGFKFYWETIGPTKTEFQGDKEEPLFLIPGSAGDLRKTTDGQYLNLSSQFFKVISYDHRYTGQTTPIKDEPTTMEDFADDAAALIEALVPKEKLPCFVLGVSFGGLVAQHLAIRHPHLIKKLVLSCCATGGDGGSPFPIHEWYTPGTTIEERVVKKSFQANSERNDEWKEKNPSNWGMVKALLTRDEKIGIDDPLRMEGLMRQLDARKGHNTYDKISALAMPVLCCGSPLDNICPIELTKTLAEKIGANAEVKLDFACGHPHVAADEHCMPWINRWLRDLPTGQTWKVVGGVDKGGIVVRTGQDVASPQADSRLSTGALVMELALEGERLRYELKEGTGPATGWVSTKLKDGKDLLVKA